MIKKLGIMLSVVTLCGITSIYTDDQCHEKDGEKMKCVLPEIYDKDQDTCVIKIFNPDDLSNNNASKYSHDFGRI